MNANTKIGLLVGILVLGVVAMSGNATATSIQTITGNPCDEFIELNCSCDWYNNRCVGPRPCDLYIDGKCVLGPPQ